MDKFSELKAAAVKAKELGGINNYAKGKAAVLAFQAAANPSVVLALLAELEAKNLQCRGIEQERELFRLERTAHQLHAQALEQRIAELEEDKMRLNSVINSEANRADAAEQKLATPVRLPNKNDDEFWFDGVFQVAKFDRAVERAISAAGFKFAGDE